MPLRRRDGRTFGTLCALDPLPAALDESDFAIFHLLADLIAFELEADEEQRRRETAEAARQTFVEAVAHDLKNPLQSVKGQVQLLRRRLQPPVTLDAAEVIERLDRIDQGTARAVGLIDEMLDAARLRRGLTVPMQRATIDLVALARRRVGALQPSAPRHSFRFEAGVAMAIGNWDGSRLERVVDNLIANAIRYSPDGGEVVVRAGIVEDPAGVWAELAVGDQGIGIKPEDRARIFEPYLRGANVEGQIRGTGLGLAGARQIVEQHGGTITVESTEGVGSTFTLRLPVD